MCALFHTGLARARPICNRSKTVHGTEPLLCLVWSGWIRLGSGNHNHMQCLRQKPGQVVFQHLPCYKIAKRVKLTGYNKKYNAVVENLHVTCTYRPSQVGLEQLWLVQGSHASWKVLDFFLKNSRTWKVLENHFGPGKSWKNIMENYVFFIGSNGKQAVYIETM